MTARDVPGDVVVLLFDGRRLPRSLTGLTCVEVSAPDDLTVPEQVARVIVVGGHVALAATLSRLLRDDLLDVEVGFVPPWRPTRWGVAHRARTGAAQRVPLIRDETGAVIVRSARWLPSRDAAITGEAVVDDTVLFDGQSTGVEIEPLPQVPGLRARTLGTGARGWVSGRAVQIGSTGLLIERDGVTAPRPARRSAFYRHIQGWLRVG